METHKVSIVIPAYKALSFEQTLRSAIGQSYENIEILVSDNCPTEDIKNICQKYPSVIYQRNVNTGIENLISAFYSGKGTFIKPLFDDDVLHPFCVQKMVMALDEYPDIDIVFSSSRVIDMTNVYWETRRPYNAHGRLTWSNLFRDTCLRFSNFVGEFSTVLVRKKKLWDIGPNNLFQIAGHDFSKGLADVAAFLNLAQGGGIFYVDEELSYFRRDARLTSNSNPKTNDGFGYCLSDWIDLVIAAKNINVISSQETNSMLGPVNGMKEKFAGDYEQVTEAYARFVEALKSMDLPDKASPSPIAAIHKI